MSKLLEALTEAPKKRSVCAVRALEKIVSPEEWMMVEKIVETMRQAHRDGERCVYNVVWLVEKLNENELNISTTSMYRHVRERCCCV